MADALSAVTMLNATTITLQKVQLLYTTINSIREAPEALQSVKDDLQAIALVLHNIACTWPSDSSQGVAISAEVSAALGNCGQICADFQALLTRWESYTVEYKTFWADQWQQSLSGKERTAAFKGQLNLCKDILDVALSTVSMCVSPCPSLNKVVLHVHNGALTTTVSVTKLRYQEGLMSEIKEMSLKQIESGLQQKLGLADSERMETENALRQYSIEDCNWSSEESKQTKWNLLQEIRRQQEFNDAFRRVCEQSLAITMSARRGPKTEDVAKIDSSQILTINTSAEGSLMDSVSLDFATDNKDFDLSTLWQESQHNHGPGHVCCLTLGILDIVSPNNQETHAAPSTDISSQSHDSLSDPRDLSHVIGAEESRLEFAQLAPHGFSSPPAQSTNSSESQPQSKEKPVCWKHGCGGRVFSSWSNLRRHQRERERQEPTCYCPRCGAYFSRTSSRDQHLANMSCTRIRRYSNGRIRPSFLKIQESLDTPL